MKWKKIWNQTQKPKTPMFSLHFWILEDDEIVELQWVYW